VKFTIVLVTGGRNYQDQEHVDSVLNQVHAHYGELLIVMGNAGGLDTCAGIWAQTHGQHCARVPALWHRYPRGAGPIRNSVMGILVDAALRGGLPAVCLSFPGGKGTADMTNKARATSIPTYNV
jgi:hypothetical protein